jgi:hypothetical protein
MLPREGGYVGDSVIHHSVHVVFETAVTAGPQAVALLNDTKEQGHHVSLGTRAPMKQGRKSRLDRRLETC